jgi:Ca2+-binding EF-hand superfamily protein
MVSGIGGASNALSSMYTQNMRSKLSPEEKFNELDTDGDGVLSSSELTSMAEEVASHTGQTINVDEAITTYDTDGDSMLNQSEMDSMMQAVMENSVPVTGSDSSSLLLQALTAYQENQDEDQLSILLEQLSSREMPPPPPSPEERFNELDSDGDGGLNVEELEVMAEEISSMTGQAIDAEEALATYDANEDGVLNMDEMENMMSELRAELGPPPNMKEGGSMADALAAYLEDSDENTVNTILEILGNYSGSNTEDTTTGVNIAV